MPNRILRDGILTSPKLARLGWAEEVMYRRLMSLVDDFGRYFAEPTLLRGHLYPRQLNKVSDSDVGKWLQGIEAAGLVRVYPAQDGERYLELLNFGQQVRAKKSKFPDPLAVDSTCEQTLANDRLDVFVSVSEDVSVSAPDGGFEEAWKEYPKRPGNSRVNALKAWGARIKEGHKPEAMVAGVKRYAAFCIAERKEPKFIKLAETFFGPGLHFQDAWATVLVEAPPSKAADETAAMLAQQAAHAAKAVAPPANLRELAQKIRREAA